MTQGPFPGTASSDETLGRLVARTTADLSTLVRGEVALAKAELKQSAASAGKGGGMLVAAGVLAFVAFLMLSAAAAYGLVAAGLDPALGFLVVGLVYLLVTGILGFVGVRQFQNVKGLERTQRSLEQTKVALSRSGS